jgi:hypothetical protein
MTNPFPGGGIVFRPPSHFRALTPPCAPHTARAKAALLVGALIDRSNGSTQVSAGRSRSAEERDQSCGQPDEGAHDVGH